MKQKTLAVFLMMLTLGILSAKGATPVAVWDGDFNATQTGYSLQLSGNALSGDGSTITIDQDVGVKVDFTTGVNAMTVMFRYSDLNFEAQRTLATSFCSGGDENRTGVYAASSTGVINGIWNTANWGNAGEALSESSGLLAFCYSKGAGTALYYVTSSSRTQLYNRSDLKAGGDTAINGCTIGGERAKGTSTLLGAATGMKITGIAIFDGTLSESEMTGYIWPSEVQMIAVDADTSVSALNTAIAGVDETIKKVVFDVADGVTISVDTAFSSTMPVAVESAGTVTLSAETQPDLSGVTFDVKGALLRSWLTPGVVGFNFRSANGADVSGALASGDTWIHDNNSANGSSTALFADGLSTLTWVSANTWSCSGNTIISGYLDDGSKNGNGAEVHLSNVPYEVYDVIVYCSSDSNPGTFLAKTINGTTYTWDSTTSSVVEGNSAWGKAALSIPVYGTNALRIKNLSGSLTIYGTPRNGSQRGGIAAIQIMPPDTPDNIRIYTLTLDGTAANWSSGTWTLQGNVVDAPTSGFVEIVAAASTELTIDTEVSLADLKITGGDDIVISMKNGDSGSLYTVKATVESGVLQQGGDDVLGTTPVLVINEGATFDLNAHTVNAATSLMLAGAGAGSWPWALTSSSGASSSYLIPTLTADATVGGANKILLGKSGAAATMALDGHVLTKVGAGELSCWNLRISGGGTLDLEAGLTSFNQWTSLDGSETVDRHTTVTVCDGAELKNNAGRRLWIDTLNVEAGATVTTTAGGYFGVSTAFNGSCDTTKLQFNDGAVVTLDGNLTLATLVAQGDNSNTTVGNVELVLADGTGSANVTISDAITAAGTISTAGSVGITLGDGASVNVTNGGFTAAATTFTLVDNTAAKDNGDGTFDFVLAKARIGDHDNYATVEDAIEAFTDHNAVLTVLDDEWVDDGSWVEAKKIFWSSDDRQYVHAAVVNGDYAYATVAAAVEAGLVDIVLNRNVTEDIALPIDVVLKSGAYSVDGTVSTSAEGYVISRKTIEGEEVYVAITNDASEWIGGAKGSWNLYSNWSTGAVPGANTAITFPEGEFTVIITDYNSEAHKCASMTVDGTVTITYTEGEDYWPEVTLYGDVSGPGKLILKRAGLRNLSDGSVTISCAFGVQYNHTTNDSFLRGNNFKLTGAVTVEGFLKIEEGTEATLTGATAVSDSSKIQANNTAVLTLAEVTAGEGVSATITAISGGTVTIAKLTGSGDVSVTNGTITLLDDYVGTLGGSVSIIAVNKSVIDTEAPVVKVSGSVNNVAEIEVTENGAATTYRLYAKADGNLYVKTPTVLYRKAVSGGWLDANSWTNSAGEAVDTEWISANLIYATIDADAIESVTLGGSDTVELTKLTIVGGSDSSVTLELDGTIAIDQHLDLGSMAGTIVKDGAGKFTAKGDNSGATLYWTVEDGTLSLGGEFDSIGGVGTVVNLDGGVLDIAGAHGGQHSKTLVVNGAGSVFTNSVGVADSYGHSFPFAHIQVKADSSFGGDEEWGAIASAYGASNIDIAEGCTFTKIGAGKFCINNMAISGAGTLKVAAGVLDKGGTCTVDNLEIDNWSNVSGGGSLTVNRCVTLNNEADATVSLADRSVTLGNNASLKLTRAGTLEIGTWRGNNLIDMTEAGGKLSLTLTGNDELDIALNVAGLDESDTSNVIINDGAAPGTHALYRSGKLLHIARNVGGMVINPVTGERTIVTYVFAGEDGAWQTVSNWRQYDDTYDNYANLESGNAPTLTGSNRWEPTLFDGSRLSSEATKSITLDGTIEGWELKLAVANGMAVSVPTINKLQGNSPMWIMVDDTSTLTFGAWGSGNSSNSLTYYVANEDGVTWNMAFNKDISLEYYLAGAGSVNYAAGVTAGTHGIKRAELTLGTGDYKTIVRRAIVKFSSSSVTFDTSELEVLSDEAETPAVLADSALMGTEDVGTYQVLKEATGIYLEYIGRTETAPKEYVISGSGTKTWTWDDPAPGADDAVTIKLTGNMALNLGEEAITIGRLVVLNEGTEDVATLTLSGATLNAGSIIVGEAVEVASSVATQLAGTLQGSGTVTYTGVMPTGLVMNDNGWKGVLWLKSVALAGPKPGTLAGDYSTLRLTGCTGYFNPDNSTQTSLGTLDLRDDGETAAFTVDNGWSSGGVTVFGTLTGDGTLGCATRNIAQRYVFIDPSEFTGTINCARTDATGNLHLRVILGDGANLDPDSGTITIVAGATAKMLKTWTAKSIINNGTLHLAIDPSGNLVNNGALVLLADNLNLQGIRDFAQVSVAEGVTKVQVDQTQSEYLNGVTTLTNVPAEITSVQINKFSGDATMAVKDPESNTWKLDEGIQLEGKAALYDFTFTPGKYTTEITNAGSRGGTLSLDGATIGTALDAASGNLFVRTHPYVGAGNYPTEFTVAVYGTMPQNEHNTLIAFGNKTNGCLALVKGETANDVDLIWAKGDGTGEDFQNISSMRAKASTEEKHLYVFEKTANSISVYLDGKEKITVTSTEDSPWPLGNNGGFQVGSVLEGVIGNVATRPASDDPATIAAIRIYGEKISADVMAALKAAFPFADEASTSERTLDAEDGRNSWYGEEIGTWTNTPADVDDAGLLPRTNANVTLTVAGEVPQRIDVVLNANTVDEPNIIGDLHITGSQALTIRKSIGGHPVSVSGILTNDVALTVHYGAIDLAYTALYMGEDATLTFELSELINDKRDSDRVYLTGVCDNFGTERVTYSYDTTADTFIKFKSLGWDSVKQRYYVDFTAPRTARDVWFDPIPGADVTNVLSMAMEVYYEDASTTKTSPILTGDTLHFKEGYEAVVLVPEGEMALAGYDIPEDVTVIFEEAITNRVSGAGTIVMDGCWPKVSLAAVEASFTDTANWTGTVDISNVNFGNASLPKLGNANSTIRLSGCSIYPQSPYEVTAKLEIYGDGLDFRGISSGSNQEVIFDQLIGPGSLMNTNTTLEAVNYLRINNADYFTGAVTNLVGTAGGTTMLFGAGSSAEGSVVITAPCAFNLVSPVYASTNLVVNGTLKVSEPGVVVTAEKVLFDSGIISIADPDAYPFFELQNQIEGTITIDLVYLPSTVTPASIQVMRVNNTTYLPDRDHLALGLGKVSEYALVKDADGRGWSLVRKGFYIRIR